MFMKSVCEMEVMEEVWEGEGGEMDTMLVSAGKLAGKCVRLAVRHVTDWPLPVMGVQVHAGSHDLESWRILTRAIRNIVWESMLLLSLHDDRENHVLIVIIILKIIHG